MASVDFEAAGLVPTLGSDEEGGAMMYSAKGKAEGFISQAVADAEQLIYICGSYTYRNPLPEGVDLRMVLSNSRHTLLRIADIEDDDVATLFKAIKYANERSPWTSAISQEAAKQPVSLRRFGEHLWFDWHPDIKDWITAHTLKLCPARSKIIEDEQGAKTTLINYFWDRLVFAS
jgi:hypothetical protein